MDKVKYENTNIPQFTMRIGKTAYVIGMCFKEGAKETMDDKVRKMIRKEIRSGESAYQ